jgi:hypothetical protein
MYIFENGKLLRVSGPVAAAASNCDTNTPLIIGAQLYNKTGIPNSFFKGLIDDFRISNTARYTANFSVALSPFVVDGTTLGLYSLDGNVQDASSNQMHGTAVGNSTYVDSDIVTVQMPSPSPVSSTSASPSAVPSSKASPSPIPSGCYYEKVQCIKAPCNPILRCAPSPSPRVVRTPRPTPTHCRKVLGKVVCWPIPR